MQIIQWIIAGGTTIFVAAIGFFQWRTAQQKAVLDLFDRRRAIYDTVRSAVGQMISSSPGFDQRKEIEFLQAKEQAYFFFGDDVDRYLQQLWEAIVDVQGADKELPEERDATTRKGIVDRRRAGMDRISQFYAIGRPLFARYMRFSQTIPVDFGGLFRR